jgi:predicted site-specific integrase-resolvase
VARLYGVSITTVERWTRLGTIPSIKTADGGRRYVTDDVVRALESTRQERRTD